MESKFIRNEALAIGQLNSSVVFFRIIFGGLMLFSVLRFFIKGWIRELYIEPTFFFKYYGFEWVIIPNSVVLYLLFGICALASFFIMIGLLNKLACIVFFLSFTYIELMDKTNYLNHYYLISLLALSLILLPNPVNFNQNVVDIGRFKLSSKQILQLQIGAVYFFGGMAKINSDWLLDAEPLKIWLPLNVEIPILGHFMGKSWLAYLFSWFGCLFDLAIPFLLLKNKTRVWAYIVAVIFHILTSCFFYIGMFPFFMMGFALIFFPENFHYRIIMFVNNFISNGMINILKGTEARNEKRMNQYIILGFLALQFLMPLRHFLYKGNMLWTEQGYRFSWNIMLIEKAGYVEFKLVNKKDGKSFIIHPNLYLKPHQVKQMTQQEDMILEFAHFLKKIYQKKGMDVSVFADSYLSYNGKPSKQFINPNIDLSIEKDGFKNKLWILNEN